MIISFFCIGGNERKGCCRCIRSISGRISSSLVYPKNAGKLVHGHEPNEEQH